MNKTGSDTCPVCGERTRTLDAPYVLLPAEDVPSSGSRTEVVVSPAACLRVVVRACPAGHLALQAASPLPNS